MTRTFPIQVVFISLLSIWTLSCNNPPPQHCANGVCVCEDGDNCEMSCEAPPCSAVCQGSGTTCSADCANGTCDCGPGSSCDFTCLSEPCHVNCDGNELCVGDCGNGDCNCAAGSNCSFNCTSGPCHVNCEGQHEFCDGVCANGSCNCGPESHCHFTCLDANCSANCAAGSSCTLMCPAGNAGDQGCRFDQCAAGTAVICPDGSATTCGASCPIDIDT